MRYNEGTGGLQIFCWQFSQFISLLSHKMEYFWKRHIFQQCPEITYKIHLRILNWMYILNWLNCHKDKFIHPGWWCPGFLAHYSTDITASRKSSHPSVNEMELWPTFSLIHSTLSIRVGVEQSVWKGLKVRCASWCCQAKSPAGFRARPHHPPLSGAASLPAWETPPIISSKVSTCRLSFIHFGLNFG